MPLVSTTAYEIRDYRIDVLQALARHSGLIPWTDSQMYAQALDMKSFDISNDGSKVHIKMDPFPGESLMLGNIPFHKIVSPSSAYSDPSTKVYYLFNYDIYLTTGLMRNHDNYMRYRADMDAGRQEMWDSVMRRWRIVSPGAITPGTLTTVAYSELPFDVRIDYMRSLAEGRDYPHTAFIDSLSPPRRTTPIFWRNRWRSDGYYKGLKDHFKQLGQIIANPEDHEASDVIDLLDTLGMYVATDRLEQIMNIWNERCELGEEVSFASGCQHFHNGDNNSTYQDGVVCDDCFESYVHCVDVDDYVHEEGAHYYNGEYHYHEQEDDEYDNPRSYVMGYSADVRHYMATDASITPSPYGEFLMGIELEVEPQGDYRDAEQLTRDQMTDYAILKRDGSLADHGFEIVTAPRGMAEHIRRFKAWEPHESLRAWDVDTCGMHVHISSPAFTQATLGKFIEFINSKRNDRFIHAIAGRHPETSSQCHHYCQREGVLSEGNPKATLTGKNTDRYRMVNTCNLNHSEAARLGLTDNHVNGRGFNTVELRIFRATLNKDRLLAQIEFAHAAVMFCRWSSYRALTGTEFLNWLQPMAGQYPHLAKWFGVRANTKVIDESPAVREAAEV